MGAIKTMKEVESALPQKKEINYVRALDKEGNPILINKEDLAQVVGELAAIVGADSRGNGHMERNYQDPRTCSVKAHTGELINKMGFLLFYDIFQCSVIIAQKRTTAGGKYEYVFSL